MREEVAKLGDDQGYEGMPMEEFEAATYIRGVLGKGWRKNAKEDVSC